MDIDFNAEHAPTYTRERVMNLVNRAAAPWALAGVVALTSCQSAYKYAVPPGTASATVNLVVWSYLGKHISFIKLKDNECSDPGIVWDGVWDGLANGALELQVAAGERFLFAIRTRHKGGVTLLSPNEVGFETTTCTMFGSFVPQANQTYTLRAVNGGDKCGIAAVLLAPDWRPEPSFEHEPECNLEF